MHRALHFKLFCIVYSIAFWNNKYHIISYADIKNKLKTKYNKRVCTEYLKQKQKIYNFERK